MAKKTKARSDSRLSRRDFARGVALTAITAGVPATRAADTALSQQAAPQAPQLSPDSEAQFQAIIRKYGARLSEEQRADVRRLLEQAQKASEALRAFKLENSDEPAMIFHIYRPEGAARARRRHDR